jgi:hypothetical protein
MHMTIKAKWENMKDIANGFEKLGNWHILFVLMWEPIEGNNNLFVWCPTELMKLLLLILMLCNFYQVRKAAHHAMGTILRGSCFMKMDGKLSEYHHPVAGKLAKHCTQELDKLRSMLDSSDIFLLSIQVQVSRLHAKWWSADNNSCEICRSWWMLLTWVVHCWQGESN